MKHVSFEEGVRLKENRARREAAAPALKGAFKNETL